MEVFRDDSGKLINTINHLSQEIEVETVFNGKAKAERLHIYLDADNPKADNAQRPQVVVTFAEDGSTVKSIKFPKRRYELIMH